MNCRHLSAISVALPNFGEMMIDANLRKGAHNLLCNCAGGKAGDRVLIAGESGPDPYYEPDLVQTVGEAAAELGMEPDCLLADPPKSATDFPLNVAEAMRDADISVFLSRLGDRVRFAPLQGQGTKVMCYALSRAHLASAFGTTDHKATEAVLALLVGTISGASRYRIRTADGTDLVADLPVGEGESSLIPFSLKLFPTMIFPPIRFSGLNGRLTVSRFVLSSSTRAYDDSVLMVPSPIRAAVEDGLITDFRGEAEMVGAFRSQCERAAALTGGDPYRLNSWHTGINPFTFYDRDPYADLERWGTVAYGSPRYTHIHAAGHEPGDISIQLFDASIGFDDEWLWREGRFVFLDRPEVRDILDRSGQTHVTSEVCLDIGV